MYNSDEFEVMYDEYLEQNESDVIAEFKVDDSIVTLFGPVIEVHGFDEDLYAAEGTWSEKYEDGEYMPDWSLTWFWKKNESPENYIYYEQDGPFVSAYNLTHMADGITLSDLTFDFAKDVPEYKTEVE